MNDKPLLFLGFKIERSTYFKIKKAVKLSKSTTSEYLRDLVNREIKIKELPESNEFNNNIK